jgi:hypothetical protein
MHPGSRGVSNPSAFVAQPKASASIAAARGARVVPPFSIDIDSPR